MIQCGKIQEGLMNYSVFDQSRMKHDGSMPLFRSTEEEKGQWITNVKRYGEARNSLAQMVSRCRG